MEKVDTHVVIKKEDIIKYLDESEWAALENMMNKIIRHRARDNKEPINHYYVVNKDEVVHGIIIAGEVVKEKQLKYQSP